jgi:hypothetical protein
VEDPDQLQVLRVVEPPSGLLGVVHAAIADVRAGKAGAAEPPGAADLDTSDALVVAVPPSTAGTAARR